MADIHVLKLTTMEGRFYRLSAMLEEQTASGADLGSRAPHMLMLCESIRESCAEARTQTAEAIQLLGDVVDLRQIHITGGCLDRILSALETEVTSLMDRLKSC